MGRLPSRNDISKTETVELVHEALIREWKQLRKWMSKNRDFRTWQESLRSAQKQWETTKKGENKEDDGALLRGALLAEAEKWLNERPLELADAEKSFIKSSIELRDRSERFRKRVNQGLIGFSMITLALTGIAISGWINADRQSRKAFAEQSSSSAIQQLDKSPIDALVFAMEGGQELEKLVSKNSSLEEYPTMHPVLALQTILDKIRLQNQVETSGKGVNSITFNTSNTKLDLMATAGKEGKVELWKKDGTKFKEIQAYPKNVEINSVRFNSDGVNLATAGENGVAEVWNLQGKRLRKFSAHPSGVRNIRFGYRSDLLVTSGRDGRVKLWNKEGHLLRELIDIEGDIKSAHRGGVEVANLSDDDMQILTGGKDKVAKLWDINGKLKTTFKGHTGTVKSAKFHPDKKRIVTTGEDDTIRIWDLNGNFKFEIKGNQKGINSVDFYSEQITDTDRTADFNSYKLITAGNDGTIKIWDFQGKILDSFKAHKGRIETIRVNNKDQTLVTAGKEDSTVKIWKLPQKLERKLLGHKGKVNSIRFSLDSRQIVTASSDGTVRLWNLEGKELKSFQKSNTLKGGFESVRFIDRGNQLVTAGEKDSRVEFWHLDGRAKTESGFDTDQGGIHSINVNDPENLINSSDRILSTTGYGKSIKLWRINGSLLRELKLNEKAQASRFSPDGKLVVAVGENGMVQIWSIDGKKIKDLIGHQGIVNGVEFSPDGKLFATVGADRYVKLWSISSFGNVFSFDNVFSFKTVGDPLQSVDFSPNGKLLATATEDGGVQFWTLSGKQLADFKVHHQKVRSADFSRDGLWFATASEDNTAIIWKVRSLQELLTQGCSWLKYYLDTYPNERKRLPTCSHLHN
jgi:WD40 repeat protein